MDYEKAQKRFPTMTIQNGMYSSMQLINIPAELNGWKVYCRFSNNFGAADSAAAVITVGQEYSGEITPMSVGFEGRWAEEINGRCQIVFTYRSGGGVDAEITWSGSAWQRSCWEMTATFFKDDILVYENAHSWIETYSDNNFYTISDETYGGTGRFYMQGPKLHWMNDQTGEDTVFVKS